MCTSGTVYQNSKSQHYTQDKAFRTDVTYLFQQQIFQSEHPGGSGIFLEPVNNDHGLASGRREIAEISAVVGDSCLLGNIPTVSGGSTVIPGMSLNWYDI